MTGSFSLVEGTVLVISGRPLSAAPAMRELATANPTVAYTPDLSTERREKFEPSEADIAILHSRKAQGDPDLTAPVRNCPYRAAKHGRWMGGHKASPQTSPERGHRSVVTAFI